MQTHARERLHAEREAAVQAIPRGWGMAAGGAAVLVGLVATVAGLLLARAALETALLANTLFWTGLAAGGVVFAATIQLTEARWGRTVQRIAAGMGAFLPAGVLLLLLSEAGVIRQPEGEARMIRDLLAALLFTTLAGAYLYFSIRPDLEADGGAHAANWLRRGWRGPAAEKERSHLVLHYLVPVLLAAFFLVFALLAHDMAAIHEPEFESTIYPVIVLAGAFYAALGATAVLVALWRRVDVELKELLGPERLLDVGNLVWGFSMFLAYLWWCQYLIFWMGNLPEEAGHQIRHWGAPTMRWLAGGVLVCAFGVPFVALASRWLKKWDLPLAAAGAVGALGVLLERFLDLAPDGGDGALLSVLIGAGTTAGFFGLFVLAYLAFARSVPMFPVSEPQFTEALATEGVKA